MDQSRLKMSLQETLKLLAECKDTVSEGIGLLSLMSGMRLELDINSNSILSFSTMSIIANLISLLNIIRNIENMSLFPKIFGAVFSTDKELLEEVEHFLSDYSSPMKALTAKFFDFRSLLVPLVLSFGKLLKKTGVRTDWFLESLLPNSSMMSEDTPSLVSEFSNFCETIPHTTLVHTAFLAFILTDVPWRVNVADDQGNQLAQHILSSGVAIGLFRGNIAKISNTMIDVIKKKQDKEKNKKLNKIKQIEEEIQVRMLDEHKKARIKLVLTITDFIHLSMDNGIFVGQKYFQALAVIAQGISELKWWLHHQIYLSSQNKKVSLDENTVSLIYATLRLSRILQDNLDAVTEYSICIIRNFDVVKLKEMLANLDINSQQQKELDVLFVMISRIQLGDHTVERKDIEIIESIMVQFSMKNDQSSSINKKSKELFQTIEHIYLNCLIILGDFQFLFKEVEFNFLEDHTDYLLTLVEGWSAGHLDINPSHVISMPALLQEFNVFRDQQAMANNAGNNLDLLEKYLEIITDVFIRNLEICLLIEVKRSCPKDPKQMAKDFVSTRNIKKKKKKSKNKKIKETINEDDEILEEHLDKKNEKESPESDKDDKYTFETARDNLIRIIEGFHEFESCQVGYTFVNFFEVLQEKIQLYLREFIATQIKFPRTPSAIWNYFNSVHLVLQNCLLGFDISEIYYELFDWIREEEDTIMHHYIHMYFERIISIISQPSCHFIETLQGFVVFNQKMEIIESDLDIFLDPREMNCLLELIGPAGIINGLNIIKQQITLGLNNIFEKLSMSNQANLEIIQPAIQVGKLIQLMTVIEEFIFANNSERNPWYLNVMKLALENKQGDMQIPDEFIYIAGSLGINQVNLEFVLRLWFEENPGFEQHRTALLDNFTKLLPILGELQSTRVVNVLLSDQPILHTYSNNIDALVFFISTFVSSLDYAEVARLRECSLTSSFTNTNDHQKKISLTIILLAQEFFSHQGIEGVSRSLLNTVHHINSTLKENHEHVNLGQEIKSKKIKKLASNNY